MTTTNTITRELKELSKVWSKTKAAPAIGNTNLPDANYIAICKRLTFNKSKSGGRWQISERWQVVEGKEKNRYAFAHIGITGRDEDATKQSMAFAKQRYEEAMGGTLPTDLTEMQEALNALVESVAETTWKLGLKTNEKGFQNVFVNGVSDETVDETETTDADLDTVDEEGFGDTETTEEVEDEEEMLKKQLAAARLKKQKAKR